MGRLSIRNLKKEFNGTLAIENVSFEVDDGEFMCIVGPSGCGKTTILRLVAGLEPPTGGEIYLDGKPVTSPGAELGFVFQEYALFPWRDVKGNVEFGLEIRGMEKHERSRIAQKYIDTVGLTGFEKYYPKELSGGMKQRVGIARAFANEPQLLLMDEPFGSLDAQTRNLMQGELLKIWEREHRTVLFVTHSVDEAVYLADRIIVMSARPGNVKEIFEVGLPRPRIRTGADANRIRDMVLKSLGAEIEKARLNTRGSA